MKKFVNVKARRAERQGVLKSVFFVIIISAVLIFGIYYISNMGSYDKTKYFIHYDAFASNIMPTIEVYEKR